MSKIIELQNVEIDYGIIKAVKGISMSVEKGTIVAILGANGAGKTSTIRSISGMIRVRNGKILYNGEEIQNLPPYKIVNKGILQSPEGRMILRDLTVEENLLVGGYALKGKTLEEEILDVVKVVNLTKNNHKENIPLVLNELKSKDQISKALVRKFGLSNKTEELIELIPFSKEKKVIAASYESFGTIVVGQPEAVLTKENFLKLEEKINKFIDKGYEVLVYGFSKDNIIKKEVPANLQVQSLILLKKVIKLSRKKQLKDNLTEVYSYFPILKERRKQQATTLSGGEQQMLAIGRALMGSPEVLLLDEPSLGLAPLIIKDIFEIIQRIKEDGRTILMVEQNAKQTLKIADYCYVLELGKIKTQGKAKDLLQDEDLIKAYLG